MKVNTVCIELSMYNTLIKDNERLRAEKNKYLDSLAEIEELVIAAMNSHLEKKHRNWMKIADVKVEDLAKAMNIDIDVLAEQLIDTYEKTHGEPAEHIDGGYQE